MNKKILFAFFLLTSFFSQAQNLVPNPSFEDTISCPTSANQIDKALGWRATRESPDYFNACDFTLTNTTAVPSNFQGFQYPFSGNAYAGFIAYYRPSLNGREYFSCQLITPLTIGIRYFTSFYINLANGLSSRIACNKLGFMFSTVFMDTVQITNSCQFYSDSIISDTLNWIKVQGSFIADSNYKYLTVGNFFDDNHTDTIMFTPFTSYAYYFIDDISVIADTSTSFISKLNIESPLTIYPNPVQRNLIITSENNEISKIEFLNLEGQQMMVYFNSSNLQSVELDVSALSSGMYFIKIYDSNKISNYKFFKL